MIHYVVRNVAWDSRLERQIIFDFFFIFMAEYLASLSF